jgi:hypothetical protein
VSNTTTKVLAGCGVGCLLATVVLVGVGWMGFRWARLAAEAVETAGRTENELEERYGTVRDFHPPAEVWAPADRLDVFLAVRRSLAPQRAALSEAIGALAVTEGEGGVVGGLRAARAGVRLAPRTLEFASARNQALLDADMGLGEYTWLYWLTYHAFLGRPADDSLLHDIMAERAESQDGLEMHFDAGLEPERISWRLRRDIRAMLRTLVTEIASDPERSSLRDLVSAELELLDADQARVPWQDGMPDELAIGLEPYRDSLEESYSPATNPFELLEFD